MGESMVPRLPERSAAGVLLRRGTVIWLFSRLMVVGSIAVTQPGEHPLLLRVSPTVLFLLVIGALGWLETKRQHEHRFLANLGINPITTAIILVMPALIGEIGIALVITS